MGAKRRGGGRKKQVYRGIGRLHERSLHAAIKRWYSVATDRHEVRVGRYVIDIVRGNTLIEIQTGSFSNIKTKLRALAELYKIRLVHPIAKRKWIVRVNRAGREIGRKKSTYTGKLTDLFGELVSFPDLIAHRNFTLDVLLTEEEEVRCDDGKGSRHRQGVSVVDRRLVQVINRVELHDRRDFMMFLPAGLPAIFSNRDLATASGVQMYAARWMTYCLRTMGLIELKGKSGAKLLFSVVGV